MKILHKANEPFPAPSPQKREGAMDVCRRTVNHGASLLASTLIIAKARGDEIMYSSILLC
jgi:hypothetical protein